jgi:CubicO group peptidase (beta-lactamase class C family)
MVESSRRAFLMGAGLAATTGSAIAGAASAAGPTAATTVTSADLQPLIDHERANIRAIMAKHDIPGVSVGFIHQGKTLWIEGFGVTDSGSSHRPA